MSKVIPESELEATKNEIKSAINNLRVNITTLDGYVQTLPDILVTLEGALQTEGGYYITHDVSTSIEEIRHILDKLKKTSANVVENITWTKETHKKKIGERKLGGGETN